MNKRQIKAACTGMTEGFIAKHESSVGWCAKVSWAVQGYLSFLGVKTTVYESFVGDWNHVYLMMDDGTVIDCTADQFNRGRRKNSRIHVGKPLSIHKGGKPFVSHMERR